MDLFEYVWLTSFQITKKNHDEVKILLRDNVKFPMLGKGNQGYIIRLPKPRIEKNKKTNYLGLSFDLNNDAEKRLLWQTFKASVFHLSMHVAASDFEAYADWSQGKDLNLTTFTVGLIEDALVKAALKTQWTPFMNDIAVANALSYFRMKPIHLITDPALRLMTSILSYSCMGTVKGQIDEHMKKDAYDIVRHLRKFENLLQGGFQDIGETGHSEDFPRNLESFALNEKIAAADDIYQILHKYGQPSEVPSLLHTENHGCSSIFYEQDVSSQKELKSHVEKALDLLRTTIPMNGPQDCQVDEPLDNEASQVFYSLEAREAAQEKILQSYRLLGGTTRFRSFEFPDEDLSECIRVRSLLSTQIRRVLEKLRLYKNQTGEDYRHEVGLLDMQEAIQVIASKSQRTDIFVRDELQTREDAWTILIDASHSLEFFVGEVRGIALCLSEVARELFTNQNSWCEFAFNDRFYVIKDFSQNYTNHVRARIGGLEQGGMTYISDALSLAAEALRRRTEEIKLLVVVSDFFPSDYENAEDTLIQCVKKIEKSGIGVLGIGVKSRAVKKYFRINCVVDSPYELMKKFVQAFFEFTSTA